MKRKIERVPRLKLDDFAGCIQGQNFVKHHLKFPWGYNGFYADSLSNLAYGFGKLPEGYMQDFYTIYMLSDGKIVKINQTRLVELEKETLYVSKPGQMKHWKKVENASGYFLAFSREYLRGLKYQKNMLLNFPFLLPHKEVAMQMEAETHQRFIGIMKKIHNAFVYKDHFSYEFIQIWVLELLLMLKKEYENHEEKNDLGDIESDAVTQQFLEQLEAHFITGIKSNYISSKGVEAFAKGLHIESKVLNNHLKKTLGKSAKTVISERYMLAAKCKLIHTDIPISEICYILGFNDPAYFSRIFRKNVGVSPNEFRGNFNKSRGSTSS